MKRHNYKNLKIWSLGIEIVDDVYKFTDNFPKEEKYGLSSQLIKQNVDTENAPSDAPFTNNVGYQNELYNFNDMHNQSQIRSRGYGIGNWVVGLPPHAPDAYYTQPGSPYNDAFIRKFEYKGDLDEAKGGGRPYKNDLWKERLTTQAEKEAMLNPKNGKELYDGKLSPREEAILARGGSLPGKN